MFLGLDLGTSGLKSEIISDAQHVVVEATARLQVSRPQPMVVPARTIGSKSSPHPLEPPRRAACAARLGMMAALDASTDMLGKPLIEREIHPKKDLSNAFDEGFACFKAAQAATRGLT